jgi:hypothetical protein
MDGRASGGATIIYILSVIASDNTVFALRSNKIAIKFG